MLPDQPVGFGFLLFDFKKTEFMRQLPPGEYIAPERLLIGQSPFLVDRLDTQLAGALDRMPGNFLSFEVNLTDCG